MENYYHCKFCGSFEPVGRLVKCATCDHQFCKQCQQKWYWLLVAEYCIDNCLVCILAMPTVRARPYCAAKTHVVGKKCYYCFE
jgi:hypothetical protein